MFVRAWIAFSAVAVKLTVYILLGSKLANVSSCVVERAASKWGWIKTVSAVLLEICAYWDLYHIGVYCFRFLDAMHKALDFAGGGASAMINQKPLFPRLAGLQTPH